jgi:beta-glucosidase
VPGDSPELSVRIGNVGQRAGSTVVQVYASVPGSAHTRPPRRLVGFRRVAAPASEDVTISVPLDLRQLAVRTPGGWLVEDRPVTLHVGQSSADLPVELKTELRPG